MMAMDVVKGVENLPGKLSNRYESYLIICYSAYQHWYF